MNKADCLSEKGSFICKRYKSSDDEHGVKDVVLEGEQSQTHVGENEVLSQEVQQLKQLQHKRNNTKCFSGYEASQKKKN